AIGLPCVISNFLQVLRELGIIESAEILKLFEGQPSRSCKAIIEVNGQAMDCDFRTENQAFLTFSSLRQGTESPVFAAAFNRFPQARVTHGQELYPALRNDLLQQLVGNESKVDLIRVRADQDLFRLEHQIDGADADDLLFVGREGWQRAQGTQTVQMLDE